jgi:hypothetical protein
LLVRKAALAKLSFSRPFVTYEDGRIVTLEQFALEQNQSLEQFEFLQPKSTLNFKVLCGSTVSIQL